MAPSQSTFMYAETSCSPASRTELYTYLVCNTYDMYKVYRYMISCEHGTCGIYQQRVCRVRATCLGNVAAPGPPAAARRATMTSNGLAYVMIFKKNKYYIFFSCFHWRRRRVACETRARRVRSPQHRLHARAAAAEIPLAADTRATHTQLVVPMYIYVYRYPRNRVTYRFI